ncbi:glycosyltransferase family 4 protein [Cochlodiniinecator piscidefendens]|uniref:glycosyltransferase family 4 protein n=1 Tax=Cochlodiniinecator piscidefendens TaxID=2715756 RepID=UPI00140B96CF|nr:glycosyltransferase family 1 protein [Cochlodiniinecator piscidefendens]
MTKRVAPFPRLLDLTRLSSRVGRGPHTGVDRVELTYLKTLLGRDGPIYGLVHIGPDYVVLGRSGLNAFLERIEERVQWGAPSITSHLHRRASYQRRSVISDLRRLALHRCFARGLPKCLRKLGANLSYLNVGHSNLRKNAFDAVHSVTGGRATVLVHDVIPLDHPEFQRAGTVKAFEVRMRVVGCYADHVIYNSLYSQQRAEFYFSQWGRVPDGTVAHLGVETVSATPNVSRKKPYFVTIGTIEPRKNHALLLQVWQNMYESMTEADIPHLYMVGNRGWNNEAVFAELDNAAYVGCVVHELSGLPDTEMFNLLAGAEALLFPSLVEGFGLPLLEAAQLEVPILCMDLDVYREFLGNVPIYLKQNDPYAWEAEIKNFMSNRDDEVRLGMHGNRSFQMPTWDDHFNLVLKVV